MLKNIVTLYDFSRGTGGISVVAKYPLAELSKKYNCIYVSAESERPENIPEAVKFVSLSNVANEGYSNAKRAFYTLYDFRAYATFASTLESLDPKETLIHAHGWGMALSGSPLHMAFKYGFKVIYTAHDYSLLCPNGVYFNFEKNEDCALKPLSIDCFKSNCDKYGRLVKKQRFLRKIIDEEVIKISSRLSRVISVSSLVQEVLFDFGIMNSVVINNPLPDLNGLGVIDDNSPKKHFVFIGRLTKEKGLHMLCEVADRNAIPLVVIGDGDIRNELELAFPNVIFTGWKNKDAIAEYTREGIALVLPSLWRETSGLVVDEAEAMGLPVIVSRKTGAEEKVVKRGIGIAFDKGNSDALLEAMSKMMDSSVRGAFVSNIKRNAGKGNNYLSEIEGCYLDVMSGRQA